MPLANIVFLFYLAFAKWPSLDPRNTSETAQNLPNQKKSGKKVLVSVGAALLALAPLIVITGTAYTFTLPKIYASQVRIQINQDAAIPYPFGDKAATSGHDPYFLRTQYEVIKSKPVLYEVINRLNLQEVWGKDGQPIPKEIAYKILRSSLNVSQYRETNLVSIQAQRQNPKEAMRIANTLADVYRDTRLDLKQKEITGAMDALNRELEKQQEKVCASEQQVETLRKELGLPAYAQGSDLEKIDEMRQKQLQDDRIKVRVEMLEKKARFEQLDALTADELISASAYVADDPFVKSVRNQINDLDVHLNSLRKNFDENHPKVKQTKVAKDELTAKLSQAMKDIRKGVNAQYIIAKAKLDALKAELSKFQNTNTAEDREQLIPFKKAQQELEIQRSIMNALKTRLEPVPFKRLFWVAGVSKKF